LEILANTNLNYIRYGADYSRIISNRIRENISDLGGVVLSENVGESLIRFEAEFADDEVEIAGDCFNEYCGVFIEVWIEDVFYYKNFSNKQSFLTY
jgi:methyl coenzyme M reductase subunit C-like uncharacterized protein (methanogenesis marker protein 7)